MEKTSLQYSDIQPPENKVNAMGSHTFVQLKIHQRFDLRTYHHD
ncbi:unnamed protein product [Schistosoma mattheei]|uniref:Uncharacterized protein n=1 Tax=Schistosoma mattheei TaxID=31246 RepID=A0A3P8GM72_9TREM|nr:unnamed protein product [Schistosoma mattheei]